ncbi:rod shape-determining protein MreD [Listeria grayi]|uniref:Rod shape-determining protein MreD n=3 Tax=Listeria grayi TaxID=1641 RepID=D7UYZ3_LISGR|nr:rod shape-determining protein MreD [Listeria grayi]EFI83560.1 rod shape-determining protein MreD [Listeria grayi DSM 20601]EUJ29821.1 cell shape-determining protein MreD [Listeria grayi FSL F6-1183]MBC1920748.1 rod shape-determining protein MreD [Listeria grayi]STY43375.1 rod shape-determining protein MreD [Listeria grayi]VEI34366.1 rod shape-determining protein MreD [Listeria grayi]
MDLRKNVALPAIIILTFILEGVASLIFGKQLFAENRLFIPHFLLVMLILMTAFYKRNPTLIYAFILGLVYDIYYTNIMGVFFALFPLIVYITDKFLQVFQKNILLLALITIFDIILMESIVYAFYLLIGKTNMEIFAFIDTRLWTTILLNFAFYLIAYFPFRRFLLKLEN